MRTTSLIIFVLSITAATSAHADTKACVQQKFNAMQRVTPANVAGMFRQHFDQETLLASANGGGSKWKKLDPAKKKAARDKLNDKERLAYLAESFAFYKKSIISSTTTTGNKAVLIVKTPKGNKIVTLLFGSGCKINRMCVEGSGCAHQLF